MTDYYNTLAIDKNASPDDIKKAYRRLASQHHPDKGGDTTKFQSIQEAYATLSDPDKRAQYDNPQPQGFHQFGGMPPGFEDIFANMGGPFGDLFGRGRPQAPNRNRTITLQTQISLEEAFVGKELIANIQLPSGREQILEVKIPAGVREGTTLRLSGIGDDAIPNIPRGDIHLTVQIAPHHVYQRQGDDLIKALNVNCLDAIIGKTITFETIDHKTLEIGIAAGTQNGQLLAIQGHGMPNMNDNRMRGRLLIQIQITVPTDLSESQKDHIRQILS
jgi:curved DNA-binding protein